MREGGWVFISHSHQDINLIRKIRNHLENLGFEPIMFYLKCLSEDNEVEDLIKREIEARDWFIYADSENARASKWVKTERDYIEQLSGKKIFTIDLNDDIDKQLKCIEHIARQMKVFISYSHRDRYLKDIITQKLLAKDMMVMCDTDVLQIGSNWNDIIDNTLNDVSKNGFVLVILTENSINSKAVMNEIDTTIACGGKIIPVYVGDVKLSLEMQRKIGDIIGIKINENPTNQDMDYIVEIISSKIEFDYK